MKLVLQGRMLELL